jgi:hypothetical protein
MKQAALLLAFLLGGCWEEQDSNCEAVKDGERWMSQRVTNRAELRAEIDALMISNRCDGITLEKIRKVLLDIVDVDMPRGAGSAVEDGRIRTCVELQDDPDPSKHCQSGTERFER